MFAYGIKRKMFGVVHPLCEPVGNFCLKTPILVGLITKWSIESVTVKIRLAVENQLFHKTASSEKVVLAETHITALKKVGVLKK